MSEIWGTLYISPLIGLCGGTLGQGRRRLLRCGLRRGQLKEGVFMAECFDVTTLAASITTIGTLAIMVISALMVKALYKDRVHEVAAICETLHISRSTLYRYLALPEG